MTDKQGTEPTPKELLTFHYSPDKYIFLGSVKIKDVPGAMSRASARVGGLKVNLVWSQSFSIDSTGMAEWSFFGETEDQSITPGKLEKALEESPDVVDCRVRGVNRGVIVDTFHFPLRLNTKEEGMLLRKSAFGDMLQFIVKTYGSAGKALTYQLGKAEGEADAMGLVEMLGRDNLIGNLPEMVNLYMAQGWGMPRLVDLTLEPLAATLDIDSCFECSNTVSPSPAANFIRGHLAGLAKVFFEKEIECVETKCVAKGDRTCEFVASELLPTGSV